MEKGSIIVEVFSSVAQIPLVGCEIYLTTEDNTELLAQLISNGDGMTQTAEIEAPPKSLSMEPDAQVKPFRAIKVFIRKGGYYNVLLEGVQIFSGELSIQRAQMLPLPEYSTEKDLTKLIVITPQNL